MAELEQVGPTPFRRNGRPDVKELRTARLYIALHTGQLFMETPKAWEIWEWGRNPSRVKRIPKKRVLWVITREGDDD